MELFRIGTREPYESWLAIPPSLRPPALNA